MTYDFAPPPRLGLFAVGLAMNPRNLELCLVGWDGYRVRIYSWDGGELVEQGYGHFEWDATPEVADTGLPRFHTPAGVLNRGQGYGTVLYVAAVMVATAAFSGWVPHKGFSVRHAGPGISSSSVGRNPFADRWWKRAHRAGLAETSPATVAKGGPWDVVTFEAASDIGLVGAMFGDVGMLITAPNEYPTEADLGVLANRIRSARADIPFIDLHVLRSADRTKLGRCGLDVLRALLQEDTSRLRANGSRPTSAVVQEARHNLVRRPGFASCAEIS